MKNPEPIRYDDWFVKKVKEEFPDDTALHALLDRGNRDQTGERIESSFIRIIGIHQAADLVRQGKASELVLLSNAAIRRSSLYDMWRAYAETYIDDDVDDDA